MTYFHCFFRTIDGVLMWRLEPCVLQNVLKLQKQMCCVSFDPSSFSIFTSFDKQVTCHKDGLIHVAGWWIHSKDDPDQSPKQQNREVFSHWQLHQWQHWDKPRATNGSYWELHFLTSTRNVLQNISSLEVHLGSTSSSKDRKMHFAKIPNNKTQICCFPSY